MTVKQLIKLLANSIGGEYRVVQDQRPIFDVEPNTKRLARVGRLKGFMENFDGPFMIGRWGTIESDLLRHHLGLIKSYEKKYNKKIRRDIKEKSGFFSNSKENLEKFGSMYKEATKKADVMRLTNSIKSEEKMIAYIDPGKKITNKGGRPWRRENPWTKYLEGKKVLALTPFKKDVIEQYKKRKSLFDRKKVLPKFNLKVVKAVNTRGGHSKGFENWFEALEYQKRKISSKKFDIALLSCGAYGMPICKFIKEELKRSSIYMGSSLQLLFGLKGKRWDGQEEYEKMYNDNWKYPSDNVLDPNSIHEGDHYGE